MLFRGFIALLWLAGLAAAQAADADATAKFLAGLPVRGTALEALGTDPAWADHAISFDAAWQKREERQLSKVRPWAQTFLGNAYTARGPMFYFFSGPDFLYAYAFFPNARTYLLCGTEPVGYGNRPVSISKTVTPRLNTSLSRPASARKAHNSGAR